MMAAWIPFLQPIPQLVGGWYLLCIPLVVGVSMVYRAIWTDQDGPWVRQVVAMSLLLLAGLIGVGVFLAVFVQVIIPAIG
ncbi:MAG: hypothetical protein GY894_02495 [Planctomycetes bacterium]|jgi:hypothetical protein|nr:hypothetical protein [Planctomycetota bacterium]MCP4838218.1 hypothetical protein [Planctomycetota bacterium]